MTVVYLLPRRKQSFTITLFAMIKWIRCSILLRMTLRETMAEKVFSAIANGEEPRTVLERVKPVVEQALKNLLPDSRNM